MVHREFYDQIAAGTKRFEMRTATPRWLTLARHVTEASSRGEEIVAVIMCGPLIHRRQLLLAEVVSDRASTFLGRPLSTQERNDVGSGPVVVFHLGATL